MIFEAINCIETELKRIPFPDISAVPGNISEILAGSGNENADKQIIISLVNVEENRVSRDPTSHLRVGSGIVSKNPAVHLNLTLLFTALIKSDSGYGTALQNLQRLIQFFQTKYVFDHSNTEDLDEGIEKLILEMISINIEQLNQLWSVMGGKYQPSVLYRMRMVTIDSVTEDPKDMIRHIETNYRLSE